MAIHRTAASVGGLTHDVYPQAAGPRRHLQLGGTFTTWALERRPA